MIKDFSVLKFRYCQNVLYPKAYNKVKWILQGNIKKMLQRRAKNYFAWCQEKKNSKQESNQEEYQIKLMGEIT